MPDIRIDHCMQSLINFHAAPRVPGKVLLLMNNLYDRGFNEHLLHLKKNPPQVDRNAHLSGCRGLKLLSPSQYSSQDFCHSYVRSSYVWLNELWSRKLSHLIHLNAILKSPLSQIIILVLFSHKVFSVDAKDINLHTETLLFLLTRRRNWGKEQVCFG